jgi:hypothetical protein
MTVRCYACGKEYPGLRGLANHRRYCTENENWLARLKRAFEDKELEVSASAKRARISPPLDSQDMHGSSVGRAAPLEDTAPEPLRHSPPPSVSFSGRRRKVPRALKDYLPHTLAGLPPHLRPPPLDPQPTVVSAPSPVACAPDPEPEPEPKADLCITTEPNDFGLYRQYTRRPRIDPEYGIGQDHSGEGDNTTRDADAAAGDGSSEATPKWFHPFPNATSFRLVKWFYGASNTKSLGDLDSLKHRVISAPDFDASELEKFSAAREMARLDAYDTTDSPFAAEDGWKEGSVSLRVPNAKFKYSSESAAPEFVVSGLYYRSLLEVLKSACLSCDADKYHWIPHKLFRKSQGTDTRVYSDIYNSDAMLEEDAQIQAHLRESGDNCDAEVAILAILLWSDSTHLTSFGTASLWPIYLFLGNISKYTRAKPSAHAAHHIAYVPSVRVDSCSALAHNSHKPLAPRHNTRLLLENIQHRGHCNRPTVPQSPTHAANLVPTARRRFH